MSEHAPSVDAQATALLVARFGAGGPRPLSRTDFNRVAQLLHQRGMRPADLFGGVPDDLSDQEGRLAGLISRGTALALAMEEWGKAGIRLHSRADPTYPERFKRLLRGGAAPILYSAGDLDLLDRPTLGVVGSRDATSAGLQTARRLGQRAAAEGVVVVSGDARGVDRFAMEAALDGGGSVVGILSDSLMKSVLSKRYRQAIALGRLLLLSHTEPDSRFTVAHAMERNRYIYAASDAVIVADSDVRGGTWSGALENVRHRWTSAYVRVGAESREGNAALMDHGLPEWSDEWFDSGQMLSSLFRRGRDGPASLPLFSDRADERSASVTPPALQESADDGEQEPPQPSPVEDASLGVVKAAEAGQGTAGAKRFERRDALFGLFLDILERELTSTMPTAAVARQLGLDHAQAEIWLRRAAAICKVTAEGEGGWRWHDTRSSEDSERPDPC